MRTLLSFVALTLLIFSSLWAILHPWTSQDLSPAISRALAKIALILGVILLVGWWTMPAAAASVTIGALPESDMGQYDVRSLLPQIKTAQLLQLHLPTKEKDHPVTINVPSETLEEWLIVGACDYIMCTEKP